MMKNAFFIANVFSFLRYLTLYPVFFGHVAKWLDKNAIISFKTSNVTICAIQKLRYANCSTFQNVNANRQ